MGEKIIKQSRLELLIGGYLDDYKLTKKELAQKLGIPFPRLSELLKEKRRIDFEIATRLSLCLGQTPEYWIHTQYVIDYRKNEKKIKQWKKEVSPAA